MECNYSNSERQRENRNNFVRRAGIHMRNVRISGDVPNMKYMLYVFRMAFEEDNENSINLPARDINRMYIMYIVIS